MIRLKSIVKSELEKDIEPKENLPLLDHCEDAGIAIPFGCRAGSCGSCRVQIIEGAALLQAVGPMERDTLDRCGDDESLRLACRAKFASTQAVGSLKIGPAKDL